MKEVELSVAEAVQEDVGKGIVRIDSNVMKSIGIKPGDFVEIEGKNKTVAIADRAYPADIGLKIIRMDGYMRYNVKAGVGERVKIKKANVKEAQAVTIAPAQKGTYIKRMDTEWVRQMLLGRPLMKGDVITLGGTRRRKRALGEGFDEIFSNIFDPTEMFGISSFGISEIKFMVVNTIPKGAVYVSSSTKINILEKAVELKEEKIPEVTYEDVGGLKDAIEKIREMVELPLKHPEIFDRLGVQPPKGVLLYGPPGTGKTLLAKAVANESDASFITINGPEVMSKWVGEAEKRLRDVFERAEKEAPSVIFIDEIDAIAPKRGETIGEVEHRVVAQLLALMDGMKSRGKVIVIAATNRPDAIDPALRRPGRFDREVEIGVPNRKGRLEILKIHTRNMPLGKDVDLGKIADVTYGFVGADLEMLCKEAAIIALRRVIPDMSKVDSITRETIEKLIVTMDDFKNALKIVRPSALREVFVEKPNISWDMVGGLEEAKKSLQESVEWPIKYPEAFKSMGIKPPKGVLLYGPPGTGKTLLAKAAASESESNFITVKGPEVFSKWVGESEKSIREIFRKARQVSPAIILFDEIDAIAPKRGVSEGSRVSDTVVNQLLSEIDGLEELNDIVIIGTTNRPDMIDDSLLRPGRFDKLVYIPPPNKRERLEILKIHTRNMPLGKDVDLGKIAEKTENYSGADLQAVCREAAMNALRENIKAKEVKKKHFDKALESIKPSLSKEQVEFYRRMYEKVKSWEIPEEAKIYMG
ncbi:MAG TPA: AAA family ATPase [Thermoplasmatales archaeon]|nr:AAA family ATPase [Thermoplasmatales archaeon]